MNDLDNANELLPFELQQISFSDIFNLADVQHLQDLFSDAHGVASIITDTEGKPITKPSNFTHLCENIIRKTDKGSANCSKSDAVIGRHNPIGAVIQPCLSCGLWDAGASITVGGKHIANWLIGQVRNEQVDEQRMMQYAEEIGTDREEFKAALNKVPFMPSEQFRKIANLLFVFANELSGKAFSNIQLSRQIAEKEKAIANLQVREENLSITLHSIGDGVISADINGLVISMNHVAEKLCGWQLADASGKPLAEVFKTVNAETRFAVVDSVQRVLLKGEIAGPANHTILISKKGTEYRISDSAAPIKNKTGEITGVVLVFSDITQKYESQLLIQESEERYRSLMHNLDAGIVVHASDTSIKMNNERATQLLGLSNDQMRGKTAIDPVWEFVNDDKTRLILEDYPVNRIVRNKKPIKNQTFGVVQPGKSDIVWLTVNGFPVMDNVGEIIEIVISFIDITERKLAEEALLKSEYEFRLLAESMPQIVWITHPDGSNIYFNRQWVDYTGQTMEESYGTGWNKPFHPDDQQHAWDAWQDATTNLSTYSIECRLRRFDGEYKWWLVRGVPVLDADGAVLKWFGTCTDIDEIKRSEAELIKTIGKAEESEQRLFTYINSIPDVICYKDGDGKWLLANNADLELFCLKGVDYLGKTDLELSVYTNEIYKNAFISCMETDERAWEQKTISTGIEIIPTAKGEKRVYEVIKVPVFHSNGERKGLAVIGRDISRLYETQENLIAAKEKAEESEEKFRALSENSPAIIYRILLQPTPVVDYISPIVTQITGFTPDEHYADFDLSYNMVHPEDRIILENAKQKIKGEPYVLRLIRKDGKTIWVEQRQILLLDKSGNPYAIEGISTDITAEKEAAAKLAFQADMLSQISEAVIATDLNGSITYWNNSAEKLYGWKPEEVIGKNIIEVTPTSETKDHATEIFNALFNGHNWKGEIIVKNKQGHSFPAIVNDSPLFDSNHNLTGVIGISSDITARRQAEEELIAARQKAEESDKLKSAFLANMSHEIRTPMNGILGFAALLKEPDLSGEEQHKYIKIIEKSSARMLNIINDIVDISKIEAGLMKTDIKEINVNELIEYIYSFFKPEVEAKGLRFAFRNALPAIEAIIKTDREKLYSILTNLVKNAIKYTPAGSIEFGYEIPDTLPVGTLHATPLQQKIRFYVKDTGIGIPANRQEAIFERFIQADIADTMARQGAGLGLSISKSYAEMLGGKIWVESDEAMGSVFYFTLPYNTGIKENFNRPSDVHPDIPIPHFSNLKIVIAEDDETSGILMSIAVKEFSQEVIEAKTGKEVVEICRSNPGIDLILMDIQMPEISGYEATRQIRQFNKDVIIIAQTAFGLTGDREKAIEAGCNDYLTKPIVKERLLALIQKYFGK